MSSLDHQDLVQRTEAGEDLLDATNLLAGVAESVECGTAAVEPPLIRAVLQQAAAVLDACAHRSAGTQAATFTAAASSMRSQIDRIQQTVG